ncbi:MAG: signal transduction protein [Alphaproteobacteria bacterium]|nr:signal transduction protein [Alphaproteobacteria bacterium]
MNWKSLIIAGALGLTGVHVALADDQKTDGRLTSELTFSAIDRHDNGYIHQGDLEAFRSDVFASMDYDDDKRVTYEEFAAWDPGFSALADEKGKSDAYVTATKIVFAFWDRDRDGEITESEMRHAMNADFRRADIDDDAVLTEDEFLNGFIIIVAIKAAIRPDL